jgi:hypothetical protein
LTLKVDDAILAQSAPDLGAALPALTIHDDSGGIRQVVETSRITRENGWVWFILPQRANGMVDIEIGASADGTPWRGTIRTATVCRCDAAAAGPGPIELTVEMKEPPVLPPLPPQPRQDGWDWRTMNVSRPLAIPPGRGM